MRFPSFSSALLLLALVATPGPVSADSMPASSREERAMVARFESDLARLGTAADSVDLHSQRGDLLLFLGRFKEAVGEYEKMIAMDPAQDAPHWRLGIAYYLVGDFAKSARQFEKYHAYDGHDRENGVWKFLAQSHVDPLEKTRREMLVYDRFDREPFPSLYAMFAGQRSGDDVLAEIERKQLTSDRGVMFFAHYYVGLNEELLGHHASAREHVRKAVDTFTPGTASRGGPGYMWQVARVQLATLGAGE